MQVELLVFAFLFAYGYNAATIPEYNTTVTNVTVPNSLVKEYKLQHLSKATFLNAHFSCLNCGRRLAAINSQEEQDAIVQLIKQYGLSNEDFWLSGTDLAEEGCFTWLSVNCFNIQIGQ